MVKLPFILLLSILITHDCWSQNPVTHVSVSSEYVGLTSQQIAQMSPEELDVVTKILEVGVTIGQSTGIDKVVVMIGSAEGSNDIFYKEYDFGVTGDFEDGTYYQENGNVLTLGTTACVPFKNYVSVETIKDDGSRTIPVRTIIN